MLKNKLYQQGWTSKTLIVAGLAFLGGVVLTLLISAGSGLVSRQASKDKVEPAKTEKNYDEGLSSFISFWNQSQLLTEDDLGKFLSTHRRVEKQKRASREPEKKQAFLKQQDLLWSGLLRGQQYLSIEVPIGKMPTFSKTQNGKLITSWEIINKRHRVESGETLQIEGILQIALSQGPLAEQLKTLQKTKTFATKRNIQLVSLPFRHQVNYVPQRITPAPKNKKQTNDSLRLNISADFIGLSLLDENGNRLASIVVPQE